MSSSLNNSYVGSIDENKYIDNLSNKKQDPYWMNTTNNKKTTIEQNTILKTNNDLTNKTFEILLDNPYVKKNQNVNFEVSENKELQQRTTYNDTNSVSNSELLAKLNSFSFEISNFTNESTNNFEGIGKNQKYEVNLKLENERIENQNQPIIFNHQNPNNEYSTFLANTTNLPAIPYEKNEIINRSEVIAYEPIPETSTKKDSSKKKKIIIWTIVTILILIALFWLIFWLLEFLGVTDFVYWKGFDPKNPSIN